MNLRVNFFTQGAVSIWNELQEEVVEAGTLTLKRYLDRKGLERSQTWTDGKPGWH